jgi:hypothetical protein
MATKLLTAAGGGITLDAASTATDKTLTLPADNGTLVYSNTAGNVGIGTSSPSTTLTVGSGTVLVKNASGDSNGLRMYQDTGDTSRVYNYYSGPLAFGTNNTERARIDTSGNFMVGTTTTSFHNSNSFATSVASGYILQNHISGTSSGAVYVYFGYAGGGIGTITQSGTTAVAYNTTSDYRLKENVQPLSGALARVAALKPCTYTWKAAPNELGEGFIAHELAEVCPQAVTGEKDAVETYADEDGNEQTRPKYQGIDTSFLVATLTAAIQEQQALITSLTARIEALENK